MQSISFLRPVLLATAVCSLRTADVAAAEPDFGTPAIQALRQEYAGRREEIDRRRAADIARVLEADVARWKQSLARGKVAGNITAEAVARTAVQLFGEALAAVQKGGATEFPKNVRRELVAEVDAARQVIADADAAREASLKAIEGEFAEKLRPILEQQGTPVAAEPDRRALLVRLAGAAPAPPPEAPAATNAPPEETAAAATNAPALPPPENASGNAREWVELARITLTLEALEILRLPVAGVTAPRTVEDVGVISGQPYQARISPVRELVPGGQVPVFRVRPLPGSQPIESVEWPTARNGWTLLVRARPAPSGLSKHAFVLDVGAETAATRLLDGAEEAGTNAVGRTAGATNTVTVRFESEPPGAVVTVNGAVLGSGGRPAVTPFEYRVPAENAEVRFRKYGFVDAVYPRVFPKEGGVLRAKLAADPEFVSQRFTVQSGARGWQNTPVRVRKGQAVRLSASGTWACGADGEEVDAGGYPNNANYFKYYLDPQRFPRVVAGANYGVLLMRIVPSGEARAAGRSVSFTADADGTLALDINEGPAARHDNKGSLAVEIQVGPGRAGAGPAPSARP